ncbi:hypothetical protein NLX83_23130 [Allokutzneria sp. A3M-2-11 16]|uniref:hypothetical protein n=1 Tax=Allokutzneria sp. A3M-2-11 16 TaxID=2962043 RepID=UPI0020B872CA|nr:hypothetical protein [Allokutzneria sp. A3M-2-11 16]MCP3802165.1 hypothetical protein [Allokutzneria sp. A3M-2-11 16]
MSMRTIMAAVASLVLVAVGAVPVTGAVQQRCADLVPPDQSAENPTWYDFVNTYRSRCAAQDNHGRELGDVTLSVPHGKVEVSVTTSTALAGAIGSLKVGGREFIDSGGHGAALQYAFHAWKRGAEPSECYNPTQAGARVDDDKARAPFHESSTSKVTSVSPQGKSVTYTSQPAMFVTRGDPKPGFGGCRGKDLQPGAAPFTSGLSKATLTSSVHMGPDNGLSGLDNVIRLAATYETNDAAYEKFDGLLIAYLQKDFTAKYTYTGGELTERKQDASTDPSVRCTAAGEYCLGMHVRPKLMSGAYYYTLDRKTPGTFSEQATQVTWAADDVAANAKLSYEVYLAVGDKALVAKTLGELSRQLP